jgi:regulator of CtrA degradation
MRLTTRLMQVASWLLLQRAVNEGELTSAQAMSEKHRVRLVDQGISCCADLFEALPPTLKDFALKSLRLQARVAYLDRSISAADDFAPPPRISAVAVQVERLRQAFTH